MLVFILALFISFVGSLQIGVLSTTIILTTLQKGKRSAYSVALGGMLPEFIYSSVAVMSLRSLQIIISGTALLSTLNALVLLIGGCYILLSKNNAEKIREEQAQGGNVLFLTGFGIAILNPQLILFWFSVLLYLQDISWLYSGTIIENVSLVLGAGAGAFCLFHGLIRLSEKRKDTITILINRYKADKLIGILFLVLACCKLGIILLDK